MLDPAIPPKQPISEEERRRLLVQVYRILLSLGSKDTVAEHKAARPGSATVGDTPARDLDVQEGL